MLPDSPPAALPAPDTLRKMSLAGFGGMLAVATRLNLHWTLLAGGCLGFAGVI